jgi:hypothetical protein
MKPFDMLKRINKLTEGATNLEIINMASALLATILTNIPDKKAKKIMFNNIVDRIEKLANDEGYDRILTRCDNCKKPYTTIKKTVSAGVRLCAKCSPISYN